ncbi:MAG: O-antigen ligase family protein, partial [Rubrobacteridae bacterium]|nr:O-antigen ligase family protein [Rubrobacteridae bacterium]
MATKKKSTKQKTKQPELVEILDRWIFYLFLAIIIVIPLAFARILPYSAFQTFDQFDIEKVLSLRIITAFMLVLWLWKMFVSHSKDLRWSRPDFLVAGFLALVFLSTLTSVHMPTAIHGKFKRYEGLLTFVNYAILYFLGIQTFTSNKRLATISRVLTLSGSIVALYGILQYFGLDPFQWSSLPFEERRSFSTFGNPDLLAGFIVILLPFTIVEFMKTKDIKNETSAMLYDTLLFVICAISFLCLLLAYTRGAWFGAAFGLLILIAIGFKSFLSHPVKSGILVGSFIFLFAALAIVSANSDNGVLNLMERIKSATKVTEGSAGARIEIWTAALKMVQKNPLLGLGPDTFRLNSEKFETDKYVKDNAGKTVADNAHCYILQLASGIGVPATLLFFLLVAWSMYVAIRKLFAKDPMDSSTPANGPPSTSANAKAKEISKQKLLDERLPLIGIVASIAGYVFHLLFGVSITGSTAILWVLIPAAIATTSTIKTTRLNGNSEMITKGLAVVACVISIMSAVFASTMFYADYCYASALTYQNTANQLAT